MLDFAWHSSAEAICFPPNGDFNSFNLLEKVCYSNFQSKLIHHLVNDGNETERQRVEGDGKCLSI